MKNRIAAVVGAGVLAAVTVVGVPGQASAHYSQCPEGAFCVWEHSGYEGRFAYSTGAQPNIGSYMNDRMTSYWNRTNEYISVYNHQSYGSCMLVVPPGGSDAVVDPALNDRMTSFRPYRCTPGSQYSGF
ncbi:peptidase inhibitor family I36 protein [Streptomyces sp. DH37]|uniref:peptidase inhibitor family I36 protein n=1 Tax=Streptomyces sp. DH37 TaxID=3040122 RepID=UPI0024414045|nr:peptidase inhibitor family I36 protein [Streptomyces sp. DH37]MDG9703260.1 peptidase inhibitor family I36 protein [Streptomyces sp. DH37]